MNENFCWYKLKIDISDAIRSDWSWNHNEVRDISFIKDLTTIFNQKWLKSMYSKELFLTGALLFYKKSKFINQYAHSDVFSFEPRINCTHGINIVLGGKGSEMIWYDMPTFKGNQRPSVMSTKVSNELWPTEVLNERERYQLQLNDITLVRTDIPHAISVGEEPRICISVRTIQSSKSWNETVKLYLNKDLIELR